MSFPPADTVRDGVNAEPANCSSLNIMYRDISNYGIADEQHPRQSTYSETGSRENEGAPSRITIMGLVGKSAEGGIQRPRSPATYDHMPVLVLFRHSCQTS